VCHKSRLSVSRRNFVSDGHCHAFDAKAQGTIIGNGVGIVVLKRLTDAIADGDCIHAVIKGSAINNDGSGKLATAPSVNGQIETIAEALFVAEVEPETVNYIELTALEQPGDPIEITALSKFFRASTEKKGLLCHRFSQNKYRSSRCSCWVTGLIKTVLTLKHKLIPPA